jgi:integrase/recombinase XerC
VPKRTVSRAESLRDEVASCLEAARDSASSSTTNRFGPILRCFCDFSDSVGDRKLAEVSLATVVDFVGSRLVSGLPARVATQHNRRAALRFLFRVARRHGYVRADPTVDLVLPARSALPTRPLDDSEIELCRDVASWTTSRVAAAWALAEATARGRDRPGSAT